MSLIDAAKNHYRAKISGALRSIEVPEWPDKDGKPSLIWYRPGGLNFLQQESIFRLSDEGKKAEAIVETLILRALDADGKPIFRKDQRVELMRLVDPNVISRIVAEMNFGEESDEDLEKN